jgi:hypothetical protein
MVYTGKGQKEALERVRPILTQAKAPADMGTGCIGGTAQNPRIQMAKL